MNVSLSKDLEDWVAARVATGLYASTDKVMEHALVSLMISEAEMETDDLAWAKPLVDEAIASVERGEFITLEDHEKHMDEFMLKLKAKHGE